MCKSSLTKIQDALSRLGSNSRKQELNIQVYHQLMGSSTITWNSKI